MSFTKVTAIRGFRASVDNVFRDVLAGETVSLPDLLARSIISSNKAVLYVEPESPDKGETEEPSKRRGHAR